MQDTFRRTVRTPSEQLLTLLNGWDPAGVLVAGGTRNEYGSMVEGLLEALSRNPTREEVTALLDREVREHFDVTPRDSAQFAAKVITWYDLLENEQ